MSTATLKYLPPAVRRVILRARGQLPDATESVRRPDRPRCGAKTRKGSPCRCHAIWNKAKNRPRNGRCKFHGGASTGPKTPEGFRAIYRNLRKAQAANLARQRAKEALAR